MGVVNNERSLNSFIMKELNKLKLWKDCKKVNKDKAMSQITFFRWLTLVIPSHFYHHYIPRGGCRDPPRHFHIYWPILTNKVSNELSRWVLGLWFFSDFLEHYDVSYDVIRCHRSIFVTTHQFFLLDSQLMDRFSQNLYEMNCWRV